jgi:hypothetical protein
MSTKTTFKRVALVAVASLGFGVLTSVPSTAVDTATTVSTFTSSLSLSHTSATVVGATAATTSAAIFQMTAVGNNGQSSSLFNTSGGETITATVVGLPAASVGNPTPAAIQLLISPVKRGSGSSFTAATGTGTSAGPGVGVISSQSAGSTDQARIAAGAQPTNPNSVYFFAVSPANAVAVDAGIYTIRILLTDNTGFSTAYSVAVNFVTSAADSGAVIVPTITGRYVQGESVIAYTATRNMQATLRNAAGGRIFAAGSAAFNPVAPVLSAAITTSAGVLRTETAAIADTGVAATDHVAITLDTAATTTPVNALVLAATKQAANVILKTLDGTYGISTSVNFAAPTATTGDLLRVRFGSTSATAALTIVPVSTAGTIGTTAITATGAVKTTGAATVPLTTKAVTFSMKVTDAALVAQTGYATYYELVNGASCSAGDMSVADTTAPVKVLTDENGIASVAVTNAFPLNGCTVAVSWTGAATIATGTQTVTFAKTGASAALPTPGGSFQAALKSSNKITWTIVDQFGAVMPGATVTFGHAGANAPLTSPTAVVSDANGQVSYTVVDALAVSATATSTTGATDTVSVATVNAVAPSTSGGSIVITYKTTLDVVASLYSTYKYASANAATLIPATLLTGTAGTGIANSGLDQYDWTKAIAAATVAGYTGVVSLNFGARTAADVAVTGIPTVVTVTGGFIQGADLKLGTTRTIYANEDILVVGAKTGVVTVTAKNGTLTKTASILFVNAATDARVLTATESNGTITAKTVDFQGNPVAGVSISVALSAGAGRLGNGATSATFTTAADGTVSFDVTGAATATVSHLTAKAFLAAGFGDAASTVTTTGIPAGVSSVTVTTIGNTVVADSAQAAADAAAEATDAANAATDAANAAAEAADAATAAAQDAADAVAALSVQVSEQIAALRAQNDSLRKQLIALTNLIIKIQKKVKA